MKHRRYARITVLLGLIVGALILHPITAVAVLVPHDVAKSSCPHIIVLQQLCDFANKFNNVLPTPNSIASGAAHDFLGSINDWVSSAAAWVLLHVESAVNSTSAVDLNNPNFISEYEKMLGLSAFVMVPIILIAAIKAAFTGQGGPLALAVFLYLPFTIVFTFIAIPVVNAVIGSVDWMSRFVTTDLHANYEQFVANMSNVLGGNASSVVAPFVQLISSVFIVIFGLLILIELLFRNGALYITAVFIPFALAPVVIPGMHGMAKKLFNGLFSLIFIKFFIVSALAVGIAILGAGNQCSPAGGDCGPFATILSGLVILILAAVLPNLLIGYLPLLEGAAMATLASRQTVSQMAMPASQQIYANIRRDNSARIESGSIGGSFTRHRLFSGGPPGGSGADRASGGPIADLTGSPGGRGGPASGFFGRRRNPTKVFSGDDAPTGPPSGGGMRLGSRWSRIWGNH